MHAVVRTYSGAKAKQLFDLLHERKTDVEATLRKVPGLVSYTMARTSDGGITVTVCKDKIGTDESVRVAREWISANAGSIGASAPVVAEGAVIVQITS
jgi:hypothetical protein